MMSYQCNETQNHRSQKKLKFDTDNDKCFEFDPIHSVQVELFQNPIHNEL